MTAHGPAAPPPDPSLPGQQAPQSPGDSGVPPAASGPPANAGTGPPPAFGAPGPPPPGPPPVGPPPAGPPSAGPPSAGPPSAGPPSAGSPSAGSPPAGPPPAGPPPAGPTASAGSDGPPPGPGVAPPFAAPPTEGGRSRLWLGLGAGALALLLCCGGGGTAVVGLLVSGVQAIEEQGRTVSSEYYRALSDGDYGRAYDQLCDDAQRRESRQEFERRSAAEPQISSYRVGEVDIETLTVPVEVTYRGGGQEHQQVVLAQDPQTGGMEVCGVN